MDQGSFSPEKVTAPKHLEQLAIELAELDPRPVTYFTPDNINEVRSRYLEGGTQAINELTYSELDSLDFDERAEQYDLIMEEVAAHPDIPLNHMHIYKGYVRRNALINELMRQAMLFRNSTDEEKEQARIRFMNINKELYGEPKTDTAAAIAAEVLADTSEIENNELQKIRQEFKDLLPQELISSTHNASKLKMSEETKEFLDDFVKYMYSPLLISLDEWAKNRGLEETEKVDAQGIAAAFQYIIDRNFPDSGWNIKLENANAIKVVCSIKEIIVPIERTPVMVKKLRGLVVHELGVHMLRSIIGEGSDLIPQRLGFANYLDAEEGLAKTVESVVVGGEERTGYQHYLTATLLNRGYNFDQAFEVMWRYKVLDAYLDKTPENIDNEYLDKQKRNAFNFMIRSIRGTNELPWHTVLSYRNGSQIVTDFIEENKRDPELMTLLFLGKIDPTQPNHVRGALDARARY